VLYINDADGRRLARDEPGEPHEIYAGAWRGERKPWTIISGGPAAEGGIYKTTDGGDTWTNLSRGLPPRLIGKTPSTSSPSNPRRVYASSRLPEPRPASTAPTMRARASRR
jgi:hypothetical protein